MVCMFSGRFAAIVFRGACRRPRSQRVPQFEGPELVGVAPAHGAIDFDDFVGDFGDAFGGVAGRGRCRASRGRCRRGRPGDQGSQALRQVFDILRGFGGGEFYLQRRVVFEGVQVDGVDLFFLADALVETLAGFFAEPAALDHFGVESGIRKRSRHGSLGTASIEIGADVGPDVQADDIEQAEAGAVGQAD